MFDKKNRYDVNPTMEMLGHHSAEAIFSGEAKEVMDVYRSMEDFEPITLAIDMLNMGIILGKRAERARRKAARS